MRTKAIIHQDIKRVQHLCDVLVLNIATIGNRNLSTSKHDVAALTNIKVGQLRKAETHLKYLYDELDIVTKYGAYLNTVNDKQQDGN